MLIQISNALLEMLIIANNSNESSSSRFPRYTRNCWELLHHGRRAGQEEMTEIQVVSGKTNLILHIETYQL